MRTKAETGVRQLQVKSHQRLSATIRSKQEAKKDSATGFRGNMALLTPGFWTSSLQSCETIKFCYLKPSGLGHFVIVNLEI